MQSFVRISLANLAAFTLLVLPTIASGLGLKAAGARPLAEIARSAARTAGNRPWASHVKASAPCSARRSAPRAVAVNPTLVSPDPNQAR